MSLKCFDCGRLQLYISLRITMRPPRTVPYVPVIFAALHGLISFMKFVYYAVNGLPRDAGLQLLQIIILAIFTGIAGSLPIQVARVSPTVARSTDVCFYLVIRKSCSHITGTICQSFMSRG